MVYPALLPLMRTPRLPVVDWTDAPAILNGLVRFVERRNPVSARVPPHFNWPLPPPWTNPSNQWMRLGRSQSQFPRTGDENNLSPIGNGAMISRFPRTKPSHYTNYANLAPESCNIGLMYMNILLVVNFWDSSRPNTVPLLCSNTTEQSISHCSTVSDEPWREGWAGGASKPQSRECSLSSHLIHAMFFATSAFSAPSYLFI